MKRGLLRIILAAPISSLYFREVTIISDIEFGVVENEVSKPVNILALDQARNCGFSIFNTVTKELISYGCYSYPNSRYTFPQAVLHIENVVNDLIKNNNIGYVAIEGIQLRQNPRSYAALAQLQGVLVNLFEKLKIPYTIVQPSSWQSYCNARGRSTQEKKANVTELKTGNEITNSDVKASKKKSKVLSIQFIKDKYRIETYNDNIADAICIGEFVVNNMIKFFSEDILNEQDNK